MTRPGRIRLVAAIAVLLLVVAGCGPAGRPGPPTGPESAPDTPLTIVRHGSEVTLAGAVADPLAEQTLLDLVAASVPDGVTVVDNLGVEPSARTLDFTSAGPVFETVATIPDFELAVTGDTVAVSGTATVREQDAVATAVADTWPEAKVIDQLRIRPAHSALPG